MQIFGSKKPKWNRQESQHLGARKTNGINYTICFSCSQDLAILFIPFVFLLPKICIKTKVAYFGSPVYTICFSCSQIFALLFIPFVFLAPRCWLSCLFHLVFLLPKICIKTKVAYFGSLVYTICFSCSQILALLFIPFVFLAPRCWLSKWYKQKSQNLVARKTNGINRRAKIWEQEKQMI
jgi:predicted RNA-binding Zn-ribbon protein involved in translation (DUF1610 family)